MKAAVYVQYGAPDVLQVKEMEKPMPKDKEVLVRVRATAINSGDVRLRKADPFAVRFIFGLMKPEVNILGAVFSGEVESVGKGVKQFKPGDTVFGHTDMRFGSYAEYLCVPEEGSIVPKPASLSHTEAAAIPFGGLAALHFIKNAEVKPGQKVLVVGASGAVGSAAVQLAKSQGAHVTGVCSAANMDLVRSIGADHVIDYTVEDFTRNGETYDVIFDTVRAISVSRSRWSLNKNGIMILSAAGVSEMLQGLWISLKSSVRVLTGVIRHTTADIDYLRNLIETGKYKPVVDKTYALDQIAEAHAYVERGHKKGNVAIAV